MNGVCIVNTAVNQLILIDKSIVYDNFVHGMRSNWQSSDNPLTQPLNVVASWFCNEYCASNYRNEIHWSDIRWYWRGGYIGPVLLELWHKLWHDGLHFNECISFSVLRSLGWFAEADVTDGRVSCIFERYTDIFGYTRAWMQIWFIKEAHLRATHQ